MRYILNNKILFGIAIIFLFAFSFSSASAHIGAPTGSLVPCGVVDKPSCNVCHLYELAHNIIDFLLWVVATPILVIALLFAGFLWLTSAGSEEKISKGKSIFSSAVIGFIIAFGAWLIINTIMDTLVFKNPFNGSAWTDTSFCSQSPFVSGGVTTTQPPVTQPPITQPPTTGLTCAASNISPLVSQMISCVITKASAQNLSVPMPTSNQLNTGCHACQSPNKPSSGCSNSGFGISCHYGGTACTGQGNAADFSLPSNQRTAANWNALMSIVTSCGASSARCELGSANVGCGGGPDHIHANASGSCGCN